MLAWEQIRVDPSQYQRRLGEYASQTVEAIVAEGFRVEKFDPIPVLQTDDGWVCGGDGHSRLEALKRLRATGQSVPDRVPCRIVDEAQALELADTANVSRTAFTPVEEARIIRRRRSQGHDWQQIARDMHKSTKAVQELDLLCNLSAHLQSLVGTAYGLTVSQGIRFGKAAARFGWDAGTQQQVWLALKDADVTDRVFSIALEAIGNRLQEAGTARDGMLFEVPASVRAAVKELDDLYKRTQAARKALCAIRRHVSLFADPELIAALGAPLDRELYRLEKRLEREAFALGDRRGVNKMQPTRPDLEAA